MQILIITENPNLILKELDQQQDYITVTGIDSINYIGFSRFSKIIIDCSGIHDSLRKLSLGIHDDRVTSSLWHLLSYHNTFKLFFLIEKSSGRPSQEMNNLGVSFITLCEIKKLDAAENFSASEAFAGGSIKSNYKQLLTADDIRSLHQQGKNTIPAGSRMTSWAAEVAESLNIKASELHRLTLILPVQIKCKKDLLNKREEIFSRSGQFPNLFFLLTAPYLPVFNEMFPSLIGRTISATLHWESHGAFTGEVSAAMLSDMKCYGAVVPARAPYNKAENLNKAMQLASKNCLKLFSTFTLASHGTCDIIATDQKEIGALIPMYPAEAVDIQKLPESGAILVNDDFLRHLPSGKEI